MITLRSHQRLGDLVVSANTLTFTSIKPDNRDESLFTSRTLLPPLEEAVFVDDFTVDVEIEKASVYALCGDSAIVYDSVYGTAYIPDWVDVSYGELEEELPTNIPHIEDVENNFSDELYLYEKRFAVTDSVCCKTDSIGIHRFTMKMTPSAYVERCDKTNYLVEDVKVYDLNAITTTVVSDMDITMEGGVSSSANVSTIKTMKVTCNKNNYIDLFLDLDGILEIENLPTGLSYSRKHIKGTPVKSGSYTSTVKFDPNMTDSQDYIIRFSIPELERLK